MKLSTAEGKSGTFVKVMEHGGRPRWGTLIGKTETSRHRRRNCPKLRVRFFDGDRERAVRLDCVQIVPITQFTGRVSDE